MTPDQIARDYLRRARARRLALDTLLNSAVYPDVVREGQEMVELILKGALRFDRLPDEWSPALDELGSSLNRLARERARAFYGDEENDVPASDLFAEDDARRALAVVDRLLGMFERLVAGERP